MRRLSTAALAALVVAAGANAWAAPTRDHLQCFKIKDATAKKAYTADLTTGNASFPAVEPGCSIRIPAKQFCIDVSKDNVMPTPPGGDAGAAAQPYLCYKASCNKLATSLNATDQFGTHAVEVKSTSLVCAPVAAPVPTQTPATCSEVKANASPTTMPDGTYTLYIGGNVAKPWQAFCRGMNTVAPKEYLDVDDTTNFSQISNGRDVATTSYRKLRIDPVLLTIDPLDYAFATNTGFSNFTPVLPGGLPTIPAGWAEFQPYRSNDGPVAEARANLAGTAFVFSEDILANSLADFFCPVSSANSAPGADAGSGTEIAFDLSAFHLTAINSNLGSLSDVSLDPGDATTREVANCQNLGPGSMFTSASWPLQYVAP